MHTRADTELPPVGLVEFILVSNGVVDTETVIAELADCDYAVTRTFVEALLHQMTNRGLLVRNGQEYVTVDGVLYSTEVDAYIPLGEATDIELYETVSSDLMLENPFSSMALDELMERVVRKKWADAQDEIVNSCCK